MKSLNQPGWNK